MCIRGVSLDKFVSGGVGHNISCLLQKILEGWQIAATYFEYLRCKDKKQVKMSETFVFRNF